MLLFTKNAVSCNNGDLARAYKKITQWIKSFILIIRKTNWTGGPNNNAIIQNWIQDAIQYEFELGSPYR